MNMRKSALAGAMIATTMTLTTGAAMQAGPFSPSFDEAVAHSRVMNAGYVADASQRYAGLPPESRATLLGHLEALAGLPATPDGIGEALSLLGRQVAGFPESLPKEGSGRTAAQQAMHGAGMCVIHGRLAQAADEAKRSPASATALLRVIAGAPALSDRDRGLLLRELEQAFGRELYAQALKSSRKGTSQ
jgi:hypothetical protein